MLNSKSKKIRKSLKVKKDKTQLKLENFLDTSLTVKAPVTTIPNIKKRTPPSPEEPTAKKLNIVRKIKKK